MSKIPSLGRAWPVTTIPLYRTEAGGRLAARFLETSRRLIRHLTAITEVRKTDRQEYYVEEYRRYPLPDALPRFEFRFSRRSLDKEIVRQLRREGDFALSQEKARELTPQERRFFAGFGYLFVRAAYELNHLKKRPELQHLPVCQGWAFLCGAELLFQGGTAVPRLFGLEALAAARECAENQGISASRRSRMKVKSALLMSDRLGAGLVTALEVYLGKAKLGVQNDKLFPHRAFEVREVTDPDRKAQARSRYLIIGDL
jgi:hypothetical protein